MSLLAFGLNHATAPIEVRERVAFGADVLPAALGELTGRTGAREAAILSTCNRTEVYCAISPGDGSRPIRWLEDFHGFREGELAPYLYAHPDASAVKHVLRVASGLDSMVIGEPQVLGQLKQAYQAALKAGSIGQRLGRLFQHSFRVAKQIRSGTAIGAHPVSVAFAAVRLAQQIFGDLSSRTALLIGAGETIELTGRHLSQCGLNRMIVANRTLERAQRLAARFGGYAIALADMPRHLEEADIVISSTSSPTPVLGAAEMEESLRRRRHRPVFIVDMAVPRDVAPEVGRLADVYLYTVDDLRDVIEENLKTRREAARHAEKIIDVQVVSFMEWLKARDAVATIRAVRDGAGRIREEVASQAMKRLERGEDPKEVLEEAVRLLTNKLVHVPTRQLHRAGARGRDDLLEAARELFDLPPAGNTDPD
jgi:glutamyl-tRNA reductase